MEYINFDTMTFQELWDYRIEHKISVSGLAALLNADVLRIREREKELKGPMPADELHFIPVGRSSTSVVTKAFGEEFRAALKAEVLNSQLGETFKHLRERVLKMSLQELVEWNALQNLLSKEDLDVLFAAEDGRLGPKTETITRNGCSMSFTEQHTIGFRASLIAALDQKEKDFVNERSS